MSKKLKQRRSCSIGKRHTRLSKRKKKGIIDEDQNECNMTDSSISVESDIESCSTSSDNQWKPKRSIKKSEQERRIMCVLEDSTSEG